MEGHIVHKQDVIIAENYLSADEIDSFNRLVVIFGDSRIQSKESSAPYDGLLA